MKILLTILTTSVLLFATVASGQWAQPMSGGGGFGMPMDPMGMMAGMMGGGFRRGPTGPWWNYGQPSAPAQALPLEPEAGKEAGKEATQMFAPMIQKADQELNTLLLQDPLDLEKIQRKVRQLDVLRVQLRLAVQQAELTEK